MACELLVAACMWDLVPWPGIKPGPPTLGAWSLNHCATREVPRKSYFLEKINKTDKPLARLTKKKRERTKINKIRSERG